VLVLCLVPVAFIVSAAGAAGPDVIAQVVELLGNTVLLALVVVPASVALGLGAALLVERCRVPRWLAIGFVAPLSVPAFVASYAWATVWPSISGLSGAALVATLSYYPFVYLPVLGTLRCLDPDLEESAAALGLTPLQTYARAVLPQLRLPVLAGALLVTLHLLAEYGAFAFVRFDTFTTAIYDQYKSTFAGPAASVLAGVLVLLSLVVLGAEAAVRGRRRHVRLGGGTSRPPRRLALGRWTLPLILAVTALFAASLGVPAFALVRWLAVGTAWDDAVLAAVTTTLGYGAIGALVTCLAALPVVWLAVRHPSVRSRALESATFVCSSLPGIVVGLAFVAWSIQPAGRLLDLGGAAGGLRGLFLPAPSRGCGWAQSSGARDRSGLGARRPHARRVTLPLLRPAPPQPSAWRSGIAGSLTATCCWRRRTTTLASWFWSQ
jgi:iron(III) transport system permease protein